MIRRMRKRADAGSGPAVSLRSFWAGRLRFGTANRLRQLAEIYAFVSLAVTVRCFG